MVIDVPKSVGIWRERLQLIATTTEHTLMSEPVPPGETWDASLIAVYDDTTAAADALIGIWTGGYLHVVALVTNIGAVWNATYWQSVQLREGERLAVKFTSVVAGDVLEVHLTGEKHSKSSKVL